MDVYFPQKLKFLFEPHRFKVAYGGRDGGKSWGFARALLELGAQRKEFIVCARETMESIQDSVHRLLVDQIAALKMQDQYAVEKSVIWHRTNGTEFVFKGLWHNPDAIKSLEGCTRAWIEEAQNVSEDSWVTLLPTVRRPGSEIWVSFNPGSIKDPTYQRFIVNPPPDCVSIKINFTDNPWSSEVLNPEREHMKATNFTRYRNVWLGEAISDNIGALWKQELIDASRLKDIAQVRWEFLLRIVVAIDPAVTSNADSDETGIVVAALTNTGHVIVLDDLSFKGSPLEWARVAIAAYRNPRGWRNGADRIVGEVNNGGDLVARNIYGVDNTVAFRPVRASRGKFIRAEPVAALYEQGSVHHVGYFSKLEDQMTGWTPQSGEKSPDRLDALVWAVTDLVIDPEIMERTQQFANWQEISSV